MRRETLVLLLLVLSASLSPLPGYTGGDIGSSTEKTLWHYGVPRVLDWSGYGLAVGTSAGYVLVYDARGDMLWSRRVNYTEVWSLSWSESGELAVATLGPPGALHVFSKSGELLWRAEFDSQARAVRWSGDLLAVAAGDLLVFDERGGLVWSRSGGGVLAVSWRGGLLAASACLNGPECEWGLYVFDRDGKLLWSRGGVFHHVSWSDGGNLAAAGGYDGAVAVFDPSGELRWEKSTRMRELTSIAWLGDLLAVGGTGGAVVYSETGDVVWEYETGGYLVEALLPYGAELLAVGSQSGNLTLLDARGRLVWSYWTCGYVWSLASYGGLIAAASSDGYVQTLDGGGALLWRRRVGYRVEAVSLSGNLVAVGGWDLNTIVLDLDGNPRWSRETGWVKHLAWHGELLAVGGYEQLFVFDKDGDLLWSFRTGKVLSLSWSSDGLLAVGTRDRFGVFDRNGSLLWHYGTSDWVLSVSWSGELLAVAVAGEGVYVLDRTGDLRWAFRSIGREASDVPWRVAASWWGDTLVASTDHLYALDRNGSVLWVKDLPTGLIAPGREFVAVGGGSRVYVLDRDGEVEWAYTSPEVVKPRERFTKLYPELIYSLSWAGNHLVVGDSLGRVFLFNETGDLVRVYNMGGAVFSTAGDERVFLAGGGGGLLIERVPVTPRPMKRVLPELPPPYDRFELALVNKTLLYASGSISLAPPQYTSFSLEVSELAAYAFLEARLSSTSPVRLMLMDEREFESFTRNLTEKSALSWTGEEVEVVTRLEPGKYFLVVVPAAEAQLTYSIYAYEGSLPSFERRRASLPMGIADYGVAELPEGRIGYRYAYTEAWGIAAIRDLYATRVFDGEYAKHVVTLQLNAFLHVRATGGQHTYWVQNVLIVDTENRRVRSASNVWNLTTYPTSMLAVWAIGGSGSVAREGRVGDYYSYVTSDWIGYEHPLDAVLYLSVGVEDGEVGVHFGRSLGWGPLVTFDAVVLRVGAESAHFRVDPAASPVPNNIELVLGGPCGDMPRTSVDRVDASLRLLVRVSGSLIPVPTAYSYGYYTAERVSGVSAERGGFYDIVLTPGRAAPRQVYYSADFPPLMRALRVLDPLGMLGGLRIVGVGEEPGVPVGYAVDLGNMTRLVLREYELSDDEVRLSWVRQYYVAVSSDRGTVKGEGWYDEGCEATVSVFPTAVGDYVFRGWERDGVVVSTSPTYVFKVDSPVLLRAGWERVATPVEQPPEEPRPRPWMLPAGVVAAVIAALAIVVLAVVKRRSWVRPGTRTESPFLR